MTTTTTTTLEPYEPQAHPGSPFLIAAFDPDATERLAIIVGVSKRGSALAQYFVMGPKST